MPAAVFAIKPDAPEDTVDFLRRFATMISGGNGKKLLDAAAKLETLERRALMAEDLCRRLRDSNAELIASRDVAETTADKLAAEVIALNTELAENTRQFGIERSLFAKEASQWSAFANDVEERLAEANAELSLLRSAFGAIGTRLGLVPLQSLQVARAQFDSLAMGFAKSGDLVSQSMCEIGACALDREIDIRPATNGASSPETPSPRSRDSAASGRHGRMPENSDQSSPALNGSSLPAGTVSSAIARIIATIT